MLRFPRPSPSLVVAPLLASLLAAIATGRAHAQEMTREERAAAAEAAFDRGQRAARERNFARAGEWFERADGFLPASAALIQAIRAYRQADDDLRAATIATALVERDVSARQHASFVSDVRPRAFRVRVECVEECDLSIDGKDERYRTFFLSPGAPHFFRARFASGTRETALSGEAGEERTLELAPPIDEGTDSGAGTGDGGTNGAGEGSGTEGEGGGSELGPRGGGGLSSGNGGGRTGDQVDGGGGGLPIFVVLASAGLTLAAGGVALWSGLDTQALKSDFDASPSLAKLEDGNARELRTNILFGVTGGLLLVTAVLAIFTDWDGEPERPSAAFVPLEGGGLVALAARFR